MTGGERLIRDGPRSRTWNFRVSLLICMCFRPGGSNQQLFVRRMSVYIDWFYSVGSLYIISYIVQAAQTVESTPGMVETELKKKIDNCITNTIVISSVRNNSKCIVIPPSRTTPLSTIYQLLVYIYSGGQFYWWSTRSKPPTSRKSLTNFSHNVVSSTPPHERGSNSQL
jgi:hypothetical protein